MVITELLCVIVGMHKYLHCIRKGYKCFNVFKLSKNRVSVRNLTVRFSLLQTRTTMVLPPLPISFYDLEGRRWGSKLNRADACNTILSGDQGMTWSRIYVYYICTCIYNSVNTMPLPNWRTGC